MNFNSRRSKTLTGSAPAKAIRLLGCAGIFLAGAAFAFPGVAKFTDRLGNYKPNNVHRAAPTLPANLRRVVVLPLAGATGTAEMDAGRAALRPILEAELVRIKRFEVVGISPERLRAITRRTTWAGEEPLPADFFEALRKENACDAVLFVQLTVFRAYAPLAIGWRLRLVDARSWETLWAVDEVFDAAQPEVRRGAQRFDRGGDEGWVILNSPRRFGAYSAAALFSTLPCQGAGKMAKVSLKRADESDERRQPQTESLPESKLEAYGN